MSKIGHTLGVTDSLADVSLFAEQLGSNFFQIFLASPQKYNSKRHSEDQLCALKKEVNNRNQQFIIHANFMLNFCNPPDSFKHTSAVRLLTQDLTDSVKCGAIGVVVHMGKNVKELGITDNEAINNYVTGLQTVLRMTPEDSVVVLETGAGQGTEVCTSIHELGNLYRMFTKEEQKRIKFCIDTCHVWAAGYCLSSPYYVDFFSSVVDSELGWDNVVCIHLNDSKCGIYSRKDRHADIGKGLISTDGLKYFVEICNSKCIPIVLETPCEDGETRSSQIKLLKSWITTV